MGAHDPLSPTAAGAIAKASPPLVAMLLSLGLTAMNRAIGR